MKYQNDTIIVMSKIMASELRKICLSVPTT